MQAGDVSAETIARRVPRGPLDQGRRRRVRPCRPDRLCAQVRERPRRSTRRQDPAEPRRGQGDAERLRRADRPCREPPRASRPRPADQAALAALEQVLADKGADDGAAPPPPPGRGGAPAPAPRTRTSSASRRWPSRSTISTRPPRCPVGRGRGLDRSAFKPSRAALANAGEPLLIIRELEALVRDDRLGRRVRRARRCAISIPRTPISPGC